MHHLPPPGAFSSAMTAPSSSASHDARTRSRLDALVSNTNIRDHVGDLPSLALPTVALAAICVIAHSCTLYAAFTGTVSHYSAAALCTVITYLAFTPMHDACHGSVATHPSLRFINNVVGSACGALFPLPFAAFKRMHLSHHKHTNDHHLDPDLWAAKGPFLLLPLRWITVELSYYSMCFFLSSSARVSASLLLLLLPIFIANATSGTSPT
jgi:fatty acid desaturase